MKNYFVLHLHVFSMRSNQNNISSTDPIPPRAVLTETKVIEIYQHRRKTPTHPQMFPFDPSIAGRTTYVARKFKVSPKTIRDIWNRRAWANETRFLWSADDEPQLRPKSTKSSTLLSQCTADSGVGLDNDPNQDQDHQEIVCQEKPLDCKRIPCDDRTSSSGVNQVAHDRTFHPVLLRDIEVADESCSMDTWLLLRELAMCDSVPRQVARAREFENLSSVPAFPDDPFHFDWSHWQSRMRFCLFRAGELLM
jgi:hypothetical protein